MKRIWIYFVMALLMGLGSEVNGQTMMALKDVVKNGYNFWLYEPGKENAVTSDEGQPLIIFLHGASLKGTDLKRVLKYGPLNAVDRGVKINAYVMAPQTQGNWDAEKVWKCVEWVKAHYPIDSNRISVIGMSLGGFGTFAVSTKYYDRLSAGMMLCGGNTNEQYCGLTQMPFWIMHGTADKAVPISRSNSIVSAMAACGDTSRLIYTKLQGANHSYPAKLFYLTETYEWLTSHSLKDQKRAINRSIVIDQTMISGAYGRLTGERGAAPIVEAPKVTTVEKPAEKKDTTIVCDSVYVVVDETGKDISAMVAALNSKPQEGKKKEVTPQVEDSQEGKPVYHIVEAGNTLSQIAAKYGTTVERLCKMNGIEETSILQIGQRLKVKNGSGETNPESGKANSEGRNANTESKKASGTSEKQQSTVQSSGNPEYHTVVSGNTLYSISQRYGTTVERLCELNGIDENAILQIGQKIKLPKRK